MFRWLIAAALLLVSCGGDDDGVSATTTNPPAATTAATTTTPATTISATTQPDTATGNTILVNDYSELPAVCIDLVAEGLQAIEAEVTKVDWPALTYADFVTKGSDLEVLFSTVQEKADQQGCDRYEFADEQVGLDAAIEVAKQRAPGTVEFLQVINGLSATPAPLADCSTGVAALEKAIASTDTIGEMLIGDAIDLFGLLSALGEVCPPDQMTQLFGREDIAAFLATVPQ